MAVGLCSRCKANPKLPNHRSWCRECRNAYMRENRPKHNQLSEVEKKKASARSYANVYQKRGLLSPQPCEQCGTHDSHKHHDDYDNPLKVRWLCKECHKEHHEHAPPDLAPV